jgi:hypothetical protein
MGGAEVKSGNTCALHLPLGVVHAMKRPRLGMLEFLISTHHSTMFDLRQVTYSQEPWFINRRTAALASQSLELK